MCRAIAFAVPDAAWTLTQSGAYWLHLEDQRGVTSGKPLKWSVESIVDNPPAVVFDTVAFPRFATAAANVPVRAVATDDLAVQRVELAHRRFQDADAPADIIVIWQGESQPPQRAAAQTIEDRRSVQYEWSLEALPGIQPGDVIEVEVAAYDYGGQRGASAKQRLSVVSRSELEDRLGRNQAYILERIGEALRAQQESRKQVKSLEIQWEQTQAFSRSDGDQLQSAELNQRQVTRLLAGPQDGVMRLIDVLVKDIQNNRLNNPELERRLDKLGEGVGDVVKRLPDVQRPLVGSLKDVRPAVLAVQEDETAPISADTAKLLTAAGVEQDRVIDDLEQLLGDLAKWGELPALCSRGGTHSTRAGRAGTEHRSAAIGDVNRGHSIAQPGAEGQTTATGATATGTRAAVGQIAEPNGGGRRVAG